MKYFVAQGKRAAGDFGFAKAPRDERNRRFVSLPRSGEAA